MVALIVLGWLVCGVIGYGLCLGDFTKEFPSMRHTFFSCIIGLTGPFGAGVGILMNFAHHGKLNFKFKPLTKEERWKAFNDEGFGILGREWFENKHQ